MRQLTDPGDPALDDYRDLRGRGGAATDARRGVVVVEGLVSLEQVLAGGPPLRSVLVTPARAASLADRLARLPKGVPVLVADRELLVRVTGFDVHRGVLAAAQRPAPLDPAGLLRRCRRVAVLVGLNDTENLGAAFRTAACLGLTGVVVDHACADPWSRRAVRVSLGWSAVLPHARLAAGEPPLVALGAAGLRTVALTPHPGALDVDRAAAQGLLDDPVALVVGPEGPGLGDDVLAGTDVRVRVPMAAGADSLNVATALGVVAAFAAAARRWT